MKQKRPTKTMKQRLAFLIVMFAVLGFFIVGVRLFYLQVIDNDFYESKAAENQTKDLIITPTRGTIYDRSMTELVVSATTQTISVDPSAIKEKGTKSAKATDEKGKKITPTDEQKAAAVLDYQQRLAKILSEQLDLDYQSTLEKIQKDTKYVRIARRVDNNTADKLTKALSEAKLGGVYTTEDTRRYYPYGSFASQVLGFTNDDGDGLYGVELQYNNYLQGVAGRVVKATNALGSDMPYDYEKYVAAQDGDGVVLTIDEGVQHYLEKHLSEALNDTKARLGVCGIVMNVKTGEVLAMATKPDVDLNNPRKIPEEYTDLLASLEGLSGDDYDTQYSSLLLRLWRNKTLNDTYQPGSTFKVFTVSSALEAGVVTDSDTFYCSGYKMVSDWGKIKCWKKAGHGQETLEQTLMNSCNVAMMDIGAKMGIDLFRKYFYAYGLTEKTNIDLPGEATGIFFSDGMGETDLATASFGQNFQVTPIQELCMAAAAVNGGSLVSPHIVSEIVDSEKNIKQTTSTKIKRQVVSQDTSKLMRQYLEAVVSDGTGQNAYVAGYRVGGKTATTEKQPKNAGLRIASFIGIAPMDDPTYAVFIMIDEPQGTLKGGGAIAAPVCGRVFEDILPYLGVEAVYSEDETDRQEITIPTVVGKSTEEAKASLEALGLSCTVKGKGETVTEQMPVAGIALQSGNQVVLYTGDAEKSTDKVTVPSVSGMNVENAQTALENVGLYMKQNGIASWRISTASLAITQSPAAGSEVSPGTVVTVAFGNNVTSEE